MIIQSKGRPNSVGFSFREQKCFLTAGVAMTKGLTYPVSLTDLNTDGSFKTTTAVAIPAQLGSLHVLALETVAAGEQVHCKLAGQGFMTSGAAVAVGPVSINSAGKVIAVAGSTTGERCVGFAAEAASGADELIKVNFSLMGSFGQDVG